MGPYRRYLVLWGATGRAERRGTTAARSLQGEANVALVLGKIYPFCGVFTISMPADGEHRAAGEARRGARQVLSSETRPLHAPARLCFSFGVAQKGAPSHPSLLSGIKGSSPRWDVGAIWAKARRAARQAALLLRQALRFVLRSSARAPAVKGGSGSCEAIWQAKAGSSADAAPCRVSPRAC